MGMELLRAPKMKPGDESVADFVRSCTILREDTVHFAPEPGSPTVATVLLPVERARVDAAGSGCFAAVHRDSIPDAVRIVRERPVDAVLVSVHRCAPEQVEALGHLVREASR
jgi:hypothetical protein